MEAHFDILDNDDIEKIKLLEQQLQNESNNKSNNDLDDDNYLYSDNELVDDNNSYDENDSYDELDDENNEIHPSDLKISTFTCTRNLGNEVDLYLLSRLIPLYDIDDIKTNDINGCFVYINNYTEKKLTDIPRGYIEKKLSFKVFSNQLTVLYKYYGFKKINVKIFSNGKLHMTGISDPEWESEHLGNIIINMIKNLKYRIYFNKKSFNNNVDFAVYFDSKDKKLKYYRRNIYMIDLNNIIENNKIKYDYNSNIWYNMEECERFIKKNLELANKKKELFDKVKYEIYKTKNYSFELRRKFINFYKSQNIININKKNLLNVKSEDFQNILLEWNNEIIKFLKNYINKLNKNIITDKVILEQIQKLYYKNIIEYYNNNKNNLNDYIEFDTKMSKNNYGLSNYHIELINSDFNTKTVTDLSILNDIMSNTYDFYTYYEPKNNYSGMIMKVYCNDDFSDLDKYIPNNCFCDDQKCVMPKTSKKDKKCNEITVKIFRPGSILINGAKSIENLLYTYELIRRIFNKHYNEIVIKNSEDNNFENNEERKTLKKARLIYIDINDLDIRLPSEQ